MAQLHSSPLWEEGSVLPFAQQVCKGLRLAEWDYVLQTPAAVNEEKKLKQASKSAAQ